MISKIISWIVLSLLILVATFLVYYVISAKIYEAKGEKFEPVISLYTIISTSMEPNIKVYDVVFDTKTKAENIKVGDVITFISTSSLSEGMTITHRVTAIVETEKGLQFRTKGDNNITPDSSLVDEAHILGKVAFKLPQLGRVQFLLQSKGGWLFALLIPALGVVIYDVLKVIRLSNAKDKVKSSLKEKPKDLDEIKKQEELKDKLKNKLVGIVPVEPILHTVKDSKDIAENSDSNDITDDYSKPKERIISNVDLPVKIENEDNQNTNVDLNKVINNIKKLDFDDIDLPQSKAQLPKKKN